MKNFNVKQSGSEVILEEVNPYKPFLIDNDDRHVFTPLILTSIDPNITVGDLIREDQLEPDQWQCYIGNGEYPNGAWINCLNENDAMGSKKLGATVRQVAKLKQVDNESCWHCKVPNHLHNTCCGWPNATLIMYPQNYQESEWNIKWHEANPGISFVGQCNCANRKVPAGGIHGCNICNSSAFTVAVSLPNTPVTLPNAKPFTVALIHDLLKQVSEGDISYSRMVEIMNERANSCHTNETVQVDRVETPIQEPKPFLVEAFADNGEHSHWRLIDNNTGDLLWSSFPEEDAILYTGFKVQEHKPESEENLWVSVFTEVLNSYNFDARFADHDIYFPALIKEFKKQGFEITKKK